MRKDLDWYKRESPRPIMREFARVALAQGLNLGRLAELLSKPDQPRLGVINVSRHFRSGKPWPATIESYRRALRMRDRHVRAVENRLNDEEIGLAIRQIPDEFALVAVLDSRISSHSANDVIQAVRTAFSSKTLSDGQRLAVSNYVLERERQVHKCASTVVVDDYLASIPSLHPANFATLRSWWIENPALFAFSKTELERGGGANLFATLRPLGKLAVDDSPELIGRWISATSQLFAGDSDIVREQLVLAFRALSHGRSEFLASVAKFLDDEPSVSLKRHDRAQLRAQAGLVGDISATDLVRRVEQGRLDSVEGSAFQAIMADEKESAE